MGSPTRELAEKEMAKEKGQPQNLTTPPKPEAPRCLAIAQKGVKTGNDFAAFMSAMMSDLIESRVTPMVGNATCNAAGKLLKVIEMQHKYGTDGTDGQAGKKTLQLTE
jgi:hypothetical protein